MAAAVADYQPAETVGEKIKRHESEAFTLPLVRTPDVLAEVGSRPGLVKVGFAAESHDLLANARRKIADKGLDLIVANDITANDAGFSVDTNRIVILDPGRRPGSSFRSCPSTRRPGVYSTGSRSCSPSGRTNRHE